MSDQGVSDKTIVGTASVVFGAVLGLVWLLSKAASFVFHVYIRFGRYPLLWIPAGLFSVAVGISTLLLAVGDVGPAVILLLVVGCGCFVAVAAINGVFRYLSAEEPSDATLPRGRWPE